MPPRRRHHQLSRAAAAAADRLARACLLHVLNEQAVHQMASLSFWRRFIDSPTNANDGDNDNDDDSDYDAWPQRPRDAFALRAWFHADVLAGDWKGICDGDTVRFPIASTDRDYIALMALMRERHGWQAYGPELADWTAAATTEETPERAPAALLRVPDTRALRSARMRAAAQAQRQSVDALDLCVSFELCTAAERRAGVVLDATEMRQRLREHRANGQQPADDDGAADGAISLAEYTECVRLQLNATNDDDDDDTNASTAQQLRGRATQFTVFDVSSLHADDDAATVQPLPQPLSSTPIPLRSGAPHVRRPFRATTSSIRSAAASASGDGSTAAPTTPTTITAARCRLQCKRLLATGSRVRLTAWLQALPAVHRERELRFLEGLLRRKRNAAGGADGADERHRIWLRMPMLATMRRGNQRAGGTTGRRRRRRQSAGAPTITTQGDRRRSSTSSAGGRQTTFATATTTSTPIIAPSPASSTASFTSRILADTSGNGQPPPAPARRGLRSTRAATPASAPLTPIVELSSPGSAIVSSAELERQRQQQQQRRRRNGTTPTSVRPERLAANEASPSLRPGV